MKDTILQQTIVGTCRDPEQGSYALLSLGRSVKKLESVSGRACQLSQRLTRLHAW